MNLQKCHSGTQCAIVMCTEVNPPQPRVVTTVLCASAEHKECIYHGAGQVHTTIPMLVVVPIQLEEAILKKLS